MTVPPAVSTLDPNEIGSAGECVDILYETLRMRRGLIRFDNTATIYQ